MLYWLLIFYKVKLIEVNLFPWITLTLVDVLKDKFQDENVTMILRGFLKRWSKLIISSSYILLWNDILNGMILKMKKFLIQWRKFKIKRSYNYKDMDFWILWIFLDFSRIYFYFLSILFLILNHKKWGYLPQDRGADVVRDADVAHRTRTDATWPQGHVAEPRGPRNA